MKKLTVIGPVHWLGAGAKIACGVQNTVSWATRFDLVTCPACKAVIVDIKFTRLGSL